MNYDRLREALSRPPIGSKPRKPTSVPPMTLLAWLNWIHEKRFGPPRAPLYKRIYWFIRRSVVEMTQ